MVRMLQRFDKFELAEDKQLTPPWITEPTQAKAGVHPGSERKSVEKIWPAYTITIHVKVCFVSASSCGVRLQCNRVACGCDLGRLKTEIKRDTSLKLFTPLRIVGFLNVNYSSVRLT